MRKDFLAEAREPAPIPSVIISLNPPNDLMTRRRNAAAACRGLLAALVQSGEPLRSFRERYYFRIGVVSLEPMNERTNERTSVDEKWSAGAGPQRTVFVILHLVWRFAAQSSPSHLSMSSLNHSVIKNKKVK